MQIELKKVQINLTFSQETIMFLAEVYIDGVKAAYARNDGQGGNTFYHAHEGKKELVQKAEAYFKSLPDLVLSEDRMGMPYGGEPISIPQSFEGEIDRLIDIEVAKKEEARIKNRLKKDMLKGLVYRTSVNSKDLDYALYSWKGHTIETMLKHPKGTEVLKKQIAQIKAEGQTLLNTNLPKELYV